MAEFDYSRIVAVAERQIARFGRTVTFVPLVNAPTDPSKPWKAATSPRAVVGTDIKAVFVEPSTLDALGRNDNTQDFVKRSTQIALVYSPLNLRTFNEVIDSDGSRWRIQGMSELKPANDHVLWFVGVSR